MSTEEGPSTNMMFIARNRPTTDETPPWKGISFIQPIGSDRLSDQLKRVYPECLNLRQRKHMAAIDFLREELRQMQARDAARLGSIEQGNSQQPASPPSDSDNFNDASLDGSRQQSLSSCNSPSLSSPTQVVDRRKRTAKQQTPTESTQPTSPISGPPGQHFVFSAVDGRAMQPKTKRKMTLQERSAYKETRRRGACPKCRKQKGKCTHANEGVALSTEEIQKSTKRESSTGLELDRRNSTKSFKSELASDVHNTERMQQHRHSISTQSVIDDRASARVEPTEPMSGEAQWRMGSITNDHAEVYVQSPMETSQTFGIPLSTDNDPTWSPHFPPDHRMDYFASGFPEGSSMPPRAGFISPPTTSAPNSFSLPSGFSGIDPRWSNDQDSQWTNPQNVPWTKNQNSQWSDDPNQQWPDNQDHAMETAHPT